VVSERLQDFKVFEKIGGISLQSNLAHKSGYAEITFSVKCRKGKSLQERFLGNIARESLTERLRERVHRPVQVISGNPCNYPNS